ncbi:MAG: DUF72 domain-containing protein [Chloroflexi bacterium]|nr:DUF72 domain-containing protein [Chloroflexota bacterium]
MPPEVYVGTSGWHYDHWRGPFYPEDLPRTRWLEFYARQFNTVELNNSFYRLPSEAAFAGWAGASPDNFTFAVKVSRFITHIKRLKNVAQPVETFLSRARLLGKKLGPLLYQLPPNMHRNEEVLDAFLAGLPRELRHVVEFRHESWFAESVFAILRKYNIGFCAFDMPDFKCPLIASADFVYMRFHGSTWLYASNYSDKELAGWAKKLADLASQRKALYAYFNNDAEGYAVSNALTLRGYLQERILDKVS